jgi:hypothetical protein
MDGRLKPIHLTPYFKLTQYPPAGPAIPVDRVRSVLRSALSMRPEFRKLCVRSRNTPFGSALALLFHGHHVEVGLPKRSAARWNLAEDVDGI